MVGEVETSYYRTVEPLVEEVYKRLQILVHGLLWGRKWRRRKMMRGYSIRLINHP